MTQGLKVLRITAGLVAVMVGLSAGSAYAQFTWTGGGADGNWGTTGNWNPATPANNFNSPLVFAGSTFLSNTNTLTGGTATGITFSAGAGAFTLNGNAITGTGSITNSSTNLQTIALGMNLLGGNRTLTMTAGGGNLALTGTIGGSGGFSLGGTGTATLSGANTYTGNTLINSSNQTLLINGDTALGSGTFVISGNGFFDNTSGANRTIANNFLLNGGSPTFLGTNNLSITGTTTLSGANRTITTNGTAALTLGVVAGTVNLTKAGTGTLIFSASNTHSGTTNVNAGTLALGNGGRLAATAVTVNYGATLAVRQNADSTTNSIGNAPFTLNAGSFLDMADGFTTTLNLGGSATFAPATGARPVMTFNLAGASSDTIAVSGSAGAGAAGATIAFANPTTALTAGNRTLITGGAGSTLNSNFSLASSLLVGSQGLYSLSLSPSVSGSAIVSVADDPNALYWTGASGSTWNTAGNWNTAATGGSASASAPGSTTNVAFATISPTPGNLATSLGTSSTVNSVNFLGGAPAMTIAASSTLTINGGGITNLGSNAQTINAPVTLGANQTWSNQGTGLLTIAGAVTNSTRGLTVTGPGSVAITAGLGTGAGTLTKSGTGTLTLSGLSGSAASNYSGTTFIDNGALVITGTSPGFTGGLTFGTNVPATGVPNNPTTGTLDLSSASATFGGNLTVRTTTTVANRILIGSSQTLTVNGDVAIGTSVQTPFYTSRLDVVGDGAFVVSKTGGLVQVANSVGTNNSGIAILDMSGLATFTANLGTSGTLGSSSTFRVGDTGSGNPASPTYVRLANTSTITAAFLGVGDNSGNGGPISLFLGSGTQTLNVNTIFLGLNNGSTQRGSGNISFDGATGSVRIRSATDPVNGSSNLFMGQNASTTGGPTTSTFDVAGHQADIRLGDLRMAARNAASAQTQTDTLLFDTGSLVVANQAVLANSTGASTSNNSAVMTLGGGTIGSGTATFTSGLILAQNAGTGGTARTSSATITIQDNAGFSFAVVSGSITMGSLAGSTNASNQANAALNVLGGTLTMTAPIASGTGGGAGTLTSSLTLNGGVLDMGGFAIGGANATSGSITTLSFQSGTLSNASGINGTAGLTKTGPGLLAVTGSNTYAGPTDVTSGTLAVNGAILGTGSVSVAAAAWLQGTGTIAGDVNVQGTLSPGSSPGVLTLGSVVLGGPSTTLIEIDGVTRGTQYDGVTITGTSNSLTYGGALSLVFGNVSALPNGTTLDIFNFTGGFLGSYASVASTGFYSGTWSSLGSGTYQLVSGAQTLTFSPSTGDIIVVPEPAAVALAGIGVGLAGWIVRRRRRDAAADRG